MSDDSVSLKTVLSRTARSLCPRCGKGKMFESWGVVFQSCSHCALALRDLEGDTWFFMYVSTAVITGVFLIILFLFTPGNAPTARGILALLAILSFFGTQHRRKSLGIGLEYYLDEKWKRPRKPGINRG